MTTQLRFGKKVRVESTFQIKHRLLLWWLKNQKIKEAAEVIGCRDKQEIPPHAPS